MRTNRNVAVVVIVLVVVGMLTRSDAQQAAKDLIAEGLDASGELRMEAGRQVILKTSRPYKRLSVARADIVEIAATGSTQFMAIGKEPGSTDITVWDDDDQTQTFHAIVRGEGGARQTQDFWAETGAPVEPSPTHGFIVLNLRKQKVHLAVSHIVGVVVDEGQRARIVVSADAQELHPEHGRSFVVPAERMPAGDLMNAIALAKR